MAGPLVMFESTTLSSSRYLDGSPMYPRPVTLAWVKQPHFPWILAGIRDDDEMAALRLQAMQDEQQITEAIDRQYPEATRHEDTVVALDRPEGDVRPE